MNPQASAASLSRPSLPLADVGMLTVCLIWGLNFSVTKLALGQISPLAFTAIRFLAASVLLWAVLKLTEGEAVLPPGSMTKLVVLGVVGNTFYQLAFMLGLDRTTATNSALILSTVPTIVAVMAGAFGLERITSRMWCGIALGTLGVGLVIATRGVGFDAGTLTGDLLTVLAVACWAGYTLGLRLLPDGLSPLRVTTITTLTGAPGLLLVGLPDMLRLDWAAIPAGTWGALGYATVLSLVVAYLLWNRSVKAVGGTRTAIYMCVTPLIAAAGAWFLLGERPHPLQGAGAVMIVTGVLMTRR
ncbi:MAG: DMT family transporter [Gemmatimonadota bacterium]|nr:DMT family transporter [Gemmatimonadota bacterium]